MVREVTECNLSFPKFGLQLYIINSPPPPPPPPDGGGGGGGGVYLATLDKKGETKSKNRKPS